MKWRSAARCARADRGELPRPRHPLPLVGARSWPSAARCSASFSRSASATPCGRWTRSSSTVPLVLVAPVAQFGFRVWVPWWLDALPAVVAASWLLSVAPELRPAGTGRRGTRAARASSPPRPPPATGCARASPSPASRTASSAPPPLGPGIVGFPVYAILLEIGFVVGAMLLWQMRALVAERGAAGGDLAAGDDRRARADRPRDPRPGRALAERHPAAHHRRPARAGRRGDRRGLGRGRGRRGRRRARRRRAGRPPGDDRHPAHGERDGRGPDLPAVAPRRRRHRRAGAGGRPGRPARGLRRARRPHPAGRHHRARPLPDRPGVARQRRQARARQHRPGVAERRARERAAHRAQPAQRDSRPAHRRAGVRAGRHARPRCPARRDAGRRRGGRRVAGRRTARAAEPRALRPLLPGWPVPGRPRAVPPRE